MFNCYYYIPQPERAVKCVGGDHEDTDIKFKYFMHFTLECTSRG